MESVVSEYGGFEKCSGIVTDGAKNMVIYRTGIVGLLKATGIDRVTLHCIIRQEVLCQKTSNVLKRMVGMQGVVGIVSLIRSGNKA